MKYWLCITNEENWQIIRDRKIWGVSERFRKQAQEVNQDDLLIFYVKQKKIGGVFKVVSYVFKRDERLFTSTGSDKSEAFPYRFNLESVLIPKEPIEFSPLIPKLRFIKRKDRWWVGSIYGKAMRQIPKDDHETITNELKRVR